ncbi:hypothetical protein ABIA19_001227 [Sinorhizobium fredii]
MGGETDLRRLLGEMKPILGEGEYVYCAVDGGAAPWLALDPIGTFREAEGLTLILERSSADAAGLSYGPVSAADHAQRSFRAGGGGVNGVRICSAHPCEY